MIDTMVKYGVKLEFKNKDGNTAILYAYFNHCY